MDTLIQAIHAQAPAAVLAITGGGAGVVGRLLAAPGGSRWLLEAITPYSTAALEDFLAAPVPQACSVEAADALAARALERARWLAPGQRVLGLGATASLVSARPKKGEHRIHVSSATDEGNRRWSLSLVKGARDRGAEEEVASGVILHALASAAGVAELPPLPLLPQEEIQIAEVPSSLFAGLTCMTADGRLLASEPQRPGAVPALLPGAFNPVHQGHWGLADAAARFLGKPVAFELSRANVDKPDLEAWEMRQRLASFAGRAEVWITRAPRFVEKVGLFPATVFVVGADTALRVVDPKYYGNDAARMTKALAFMRAQDGRFLVACRQEASGTRCTLADIAIPDGSADLFLALPPELFFLNVSSTGLRART